MKLSVSSLTHDDFVLLPVPPNDYPEDALPGSEISYADGVFGRVVLQQISAPPFYILHNYYHIQEKCILQFTGEAPPLRIVLSLKGNGHFFIDGVGTMYLEQGQFNLVFTPQLDSTVIFEEEGNVLMFNLYLPLDVLEELAPVFPLKDFIRECRYSLPVLLFQRPGWISAEIMREISYLLDFRQEQAFRKYLFNLKTKQLLHLLLQQKHYTGSEPIDEEMLERIRRARHVIESSIGEMLTIEKVSELSGLGASELKKYFKPVTGHGLSSFITRSRLNNARLLVQETDLPIKQIAYLAGYDYEQNFIQAFKKQFDYTPFAVRKLKA